MEQLLPRFELVKCVFAKQVTSGHDFLDAEIVFLQFRKMLEQIAFASLVANKDIYSKVYASFANDWRATKMLKQVEELNPEFYPQPLKEGLRKVEGGKRRIHLEPLVDGFLTKDDFVQLYDRCGDLLHSQNPYKAVSTIHLGRSPKEWLSRIQHLVALHRAQLVTGACWIGAVPDKDGKVHTYGVRLPNRANQAFLSRQFQFTHPYGVRQLLPSTACPTTQCFNSRTRTGCDAVNLSASTLAL